MTEFSWSGDHHLSVRNASLLLICLASVGLLAGGCTGVRTKSTVQPQVSPSLAPKASGPTSTGALRTDGLYYYVNEASEEKMSKFLRFFPSKNVLLGAAATTPDIALKSFYELNPQMDRAVYRVESSNVKFTHIPRQEGAANKQSWSVDYSCTAKKNQQGDDLLECDIDGHPKPPRHIKVYLFHPER